MRPAAIGTAIAGIAIVVGLIVAGGQRLGGASSATDLAAAVPDTETNASPAPVAQPTTNPGASMAARPIDDASQFYPAVVDGQPLEREAAPEPEKKPQLVRTGLICRGRWPKAPAFSASATSACNWPD
jgi:hypothetical protein